MNVTQARSFVRRMARNIAGDTATYSDTDIDYAIQTVGDEFIHRTRCTKTLSTVALIGGSAAASFAALAGFRPERILKCYVDAEYRQLTVVPYEQILDARDPGQGGSVSEDTPRVIGFTSHAAAQVYPTPPSDMTLSVLWYEPLTTWTAGGSDPGTLNLPDDLLLPILRYGVCGVLQLTDPDHGYARVAKAEYEAFVARVGGVGGMGAQVIYARKDRPTTRRDLITPA